MAGLVTAIDAAASVYKINATSEIGIFTGKSLRPVALVYKEKKSGKIFGDEP